jgi:hypothetical protein
MKIVESKYLTIQVGTHRTDEPIPKEWWELKPEPFIERVNLCEHFTSAKLNELIRYLDNDCVTISEVNGDPKAFTVTVKVSEGG